MKKIKIMLWSLVLVAALGGVLAFKANVILSYCTTFPVLFADGKYHCPNPCIVGFVGTTTLVPNPNFWCYVETFDPNLCLNEEPLCNDKAYFTHD